MSEDERAKRTDRALDRLAKWRTILAGWQLGTRAKGDPESDAVRDHREATLLLRAEVSALTELLVRSGVVSLSDYLDELTVQADQLNNRLGERFPGVTVTDDGIVVEVVKVYPWMKDWKP